MESTASLTLRKAQFFLAQARSADPNDRHAVATNLEAAIVFCRSVTFHLQSQFAHSPSFAEWYAVQQKHLSEQPISRFLLQQRNYVLKVGPASVTRIIDVSITESLMASTEFSVQVIRGHPWYRRSPKILMEDLVYSSRQKMRLWRERRRRSKQAQEVTQSSSAITRDALYFTDAQWKEIAALDLVEQQLAIFAEIVKQAEARFLAPS